MAMRKRELTVMHPNAAGIDIGSASHYAAVAPDQSEEPVKEFGCFTEDIEAMADWLIQCGVDVVAMESTGVYWIAPYEILESVASPSIWSMPGTSGMSRAGSRMYWIANGYSS